MPIYSVSQITSYLKDLVERDGLLQDVWIGGEIANFSRSGSGHSYFTLRDADSSIRCVMFRNGRGADFLDSGASVIAHGHASVYQTRGELQLVVDIVQPEGVGELQLRLEQLKLKLENEGLFEPSRKRGLPRFPRRIGVVTSPSGAVWHDIQHVVSRRYPLVELVLAPSPVQGDSAAPGIIEAFQAICEQPGIDVVIVARGGGSLEDLWPFNEESVARTIYVCPIPVISAIGHETNYTIADLVADVRAPTPSAAAELAVPDRRELVSDIFVAQQSLIASAQGHLRTKQDVLAQLRHRLGRLRPDLDTLRLRIDDLLRAAATHLKHSIDIKAARFEGLQQRLESLSPNDTLRRGYAIVQRQDDGSVLASAAHVKIGDNIAVTLADGALDAQVNSLKGSSNGKT
ncbi:MAG: exodeoxyribonuclease VII large subunit [Chloroflexi bacterium]|nr:exodeoxyribonuclease VII large subunit [Chloroflexota bacterium]